MVKLVLVLLLGKALFADFVTCEIQGQLANQLFQTAIAVAYALDHGHEARFPELKKAINSELNLRYVLHRLNVSDFPPGTPFIHHTEKGHNMYTPPPVLNGNLFLHGYFANYKYFAHRSEEIKALFAPTQDLVDQIYAKYGSLLKGPTVAVHIRTFIPDEIDPNNGIGRENWNYFLNAIDCFPDYFTVLIFSDAPQWVKDHCPLVFRPNVHFIEGNPHYFDFYFMSLCDHQVISPKSTFSWWAAWLNPNPYKIVIRPNDRWLDDDAFPSSWIKISIF